MTVVVIDNGAHTLKAGLSTRPKAPPKIIQNAAMRSKLDKRLYVGHEIEECTDFESVTYRLAFERGLLTDWDVEKAVWDGVFSEGVLSVNPPDVSLFVTEPYFNLPNIQETYDQLIFEEYEFGSYYRCTPALAATHSDLFHEPGQSLPECMIIVDSGYSFTHVVPIMDGTVVWTGVRRIDVGGKLLTNHLKELVSFRQWNMMDQVYVMNDVKEACCYVSSSYNADLETCKMNPRRNPIVQEYVMPDFSSKQRGYIRGPEDMKRDEEQVIFMENERFTVPEVLFNPSDIGMEQTGLAETIAHSIASLPPDLQGMFWANIGLLGGSTAFRGFKQRLMTELRALAPAEHEVCLYKADTPVTQAYKGALAFARLPIYKNCAVTRAEYEEGGSNAVRRKLRTYGDGRPDRAFAAPAPTTTPTTSATPALPARVVKPMPSKPKGTMGPPPVPTGRALRARRSDIE
ncbi:actin-like protein ARP6 [Exidia glandulosa HHB12029]|uniref:Actin-like protein ARP6 n=1 Tax=Exidia glandulosa HHB12029 TaxID=1314781 RepID=A0A165G5B5_EXIGL|nr:actin-like protein ARP6 [Exidia glandulosa HHB12029]